MTGSQIGSKGDLEEVEEVRVESICLGRDIAVKAVEALKKQVLSDGVTKEDKLTAVERIRMRNQPTRCTRWKICKAECIAGHSALKGKQMLD